MKNRKADKASAISSAAGVASQIPFTPKMRGKVIIVLSINTKELENARIAETTPLDNAVNIPLANLKNGDFDYYTRLFIEIPFLKQKEGLHIQPKGKYLRAFHKGSFDKLPLRYQSILKYADTKGIILSGFSYEKGINETVIDRIEDYITQIEIPICTVTL